MSDNNINPVDGAIITGESSGQGQSTAVLFLQKLKTALFKIKGPKVIIIAVLVLIIIAVYLALMLASKQTAEEFANIDNLRKVSPTAQTLIDPHIVNLTNKIEAYNDKLDDAESFKKRLAKPTVELDINFEK